MQSSVALSVQVGSGLGDCTTQYWIQDPGSLILWHEAHLLIEKKKKLSKRRKKRHLPVLFSFLNSVQDPRASQCGTGWATLPHGGRQGASSGDPVGEGNSLSLEKPAVQLLKLNLQLRRVLGHLWKSSTVHWHRALQFTKHFHVHFLLDLYKTSVNCSKQDKGNLESLNDSKMADNNNILDDIWGQ